MEREASVTRVGLILLGLVLLSVAFAQSPLSSYEGAKAALEQSVTTMPEDAVASLDALRRARSAFAPLLGGLEPILRQGLQETFNRAETAIVSGSQSDLRVQATVLQGGFQRGLYERALESAANGNLEQADTFFEAIASDLELTPREFSSDSVQSLQASFEQRLAARSLTELTALSELPALGELPAAERETERDRRYEMLSQLYSYVFVVQDSPRLPPQTRANIVEAIRQQIAERPITPILMTVNSQLQSFQEAAAAALPEESPQPVPTATSTQETPTVPRDVPAPTRSYLFIAVGLLALIAVVRLLARLGNSGTPWQDAATVLLLLPALMQGAIALAQQLTTLFNLPLLAQAQNYSLFTNPVTQLVSGALVACAALCLALALRGAPTRTSQAQRNPHSEPAPTASPQMKPPPRPPFATPGKMNWDEDF